MRLLVVICLLLSMGCTVMYYDRPLPTLTWYWSNDARAQRAYQNRDSAKPITNAQENAP